ARVSRGVPGRSPERQQPGRPARGDRDPGRRRQRVPRFPDDSDAAREGGRPLRERIRSREGRLRAQDDGVLDVTAETRRLDARLPFMMRHDDSREGAPLASRTVLAERRALWLLLAVGLVLLLAAAAMAGQEGLGHANRTDRFDAALAPGTTLRIGN